MSEIRDTVLGRPVTDGRVLAGLVAGVLGVLVWSGVGPRDRFTWWLEVGPVLVAVPVLAATYRRFGFTTLVYGLVAAHAVILMVGGHYTYAEVPAFNWLRDRFGLGRNHYDRLGHFAQGFVPAMIARELLVRTSTLRRGPWLVVTVLSMCLAISAVYEMVEWRVAVATGEGAAAFLGTQGDPWDTQKDMAMALVGAAVSLGVLSGVQDRQLGRRG